MSKPSNEKEETKYEWRNLDMDLLMYETAMLKAKTKEDADLMMNEIYRLKKLKRLLTEETKIGKL